MESYQQQLKEQQGKLQKASRQAQEAAAKAASQQQVRFAMLLRNELAIPTALALTAVSMPLCKVDGFLVFNCKQEYRLQGLWLQRHVQHWCCPVCRPCSSR